MPQKHKVTFKLESGESVVVPVASGTTLLAAALSRGVYIDAPCAGNGTCGKCRVKILENSVAAPKTRHIGPSDFADGWRLACESAVTGDVAVLVPESASAFRKKMKSEDLGSPEKVAVFLENRAALEEAGIKFESDFELLPLTLNEPGADDTMPDNERLIRAVKAAKNIENVKITFTVLKKLSETLRKNGFKVNCVLENRGGLVTVFDVKEPRDEAVFGLAVDIGTTSVSAVVFDLVYETIVARASIGNGQISFGADVINRIIASGKPGGREKLQAAVVDETINPLISEMRRVSGFSAASLYKICVASNTTMNHLLLGLWADPIRMEPYVPTFFYTEAVRACDIGISAHPDARIVIAPNTGSYVGGDVTAGTLISRIWTRPEFSLFIDLGTNGELVFGNDELLMSCACSAGPAFEGGDISCGMRATDGAIESAKIDPVTMEPSLSVIGAAPEDAVGICGSGIIDIIGELLRCGIINERGDFVRSGGRIEFDEHGVGSYLLSGKNENSPRVAINSIDIANFIRAKAAIFSAIRTMIKMLGFTIDVVEDIYIAGGIGNSINIESAIRIGMLPDIPPEKYHYIGNTSLFGAVAMLSSPDAERKVVELARNMTYLELSSEPGYMDEFIAASFLPHTDMGLFPSAQKRAGQ